MIKNLVNIRQRKIAIIISVAVILGALALPVYAFAEVDMGWLNGFFSILTNAIESMGAFISNAFSGFFSALQSWLNPVIDWFGEKLHSIGQAIGSAVSSLSGTLQNMWDGLKQFFSSMFKPVLDLVYGILYLLVMIFEIIKLVIILLVNIFAMFVAVAAGFINTVMSLTNWSGNSDYFSMPDSYTQGFSFVMDFAGSSGLNLIAGIAAVGVWVITAYSSIKIAAGGR
ncbi:MAG TPA: hypothetical protein DEF34_10200 [Desulfotomaculum sp.]|nr:MAG: hypothetical protein JL56_05855 [Desulfotomaculum sp. BICA1-6]HBX23985.1 hypothetical protein [Desulfotomaculum sp.]